MQKTLSTLADLEREAARFAEELAPRDSGATLITLSGELGAGKTAFTKAVAKALGVEEPVTSPTFVLLKIYALPPGAAFARLAHIDAYRLAGAQELSALGFDKLLQNRDTLIMLEWPERVAGAIPENAKRLTLALAEGEARTLTYA